MNGLPARMIDSVVVGAGPGGLAASAALTDRGVEHVVLERGRVGQTWRDQRWDSLRLNNPGWMNPMLGPQPADTYLTAREVLSRLNTMSGTCPVREFTHVTRLIADNGQWIVQVGNGLIQARTVVIATGGENQPRTPRMTRKMPNWIAQYHAADYRNPRQLPEGGVLVVGSGQSGCQIAEELRAAGRRVILATSPIGRAPARHRGKDTVEWLFHSGFFDQRTLDLPDISITRQPQPLIAPGGRSLSLQSLARAGVTLAGRLTGVGNETATFDDSAPANVAAADVFAARITAMLDQIIGPSDPSLPDEPDEAAGPIEIDPPRTLDLRAARVGSIIWSTGFTGDFTWLPTDLVDANGQPRHRNGAAAAAGVWYIGLRWLTHRASGNFLGFPTDARTAADAVATHLDAIADWSSNQARLRR
jgi:putative flavoprotein involved in K+ transport